MQKRNLLYLSIVAAVIFCFSYAQAALQFLPRYQGSYGTRNQEGGRDKIEVTCATYGGVEKDTNQTCTGQFSRAGLTCYKSCSCDKSKFQYTIASHQGDGKLCESLSNACTDSAGTSYSNCVLNICNVRNSTWIGESSKASYTSNNYTCTSQETEGKDGTCYVCACPSDWATGSCPTNAEDCSTCKAIDPYTESKFNLVSCKVGYYKNGNSCTQCPAGSTCDGINKTLCPAGSYSAAGASTCSQCPAGSYSAAGASICSQCQAGTYSTAGSSKCLDCRAGTYSNAGASSCTSCSAGKYSSAKASYCNSCSAGTYSSAGASSCTSCPAGKYSSSGASVCSTCPAGKYSSSGASYCKTCSAGKYSSSGASYCKTCSAGTYSRSGSSYCSSCTGNTFSLAGASGCTTCGSGTEANSSHTGCETTETALDKCIREIKSKYSNLNFISDESDFANIDFFDGRTTLLTNDIDIYSEVSVYAGIQSIVGPSYFSDISSCTESDSKVTMRIQSGGRFIMDGELFLENFTIEGGDVYYKDGYMGLKNMEFVDTTISRASGHCSEWESVELTSTQVVLNNTNICDDGINCGTYNSTIKSGYIQACGISSCEWDKGWDFQYPRDITCYPEENECHIWVTCRSSCGNTEQGPYYIGLYDNPEAKARSAANYFCFDAISAMGETTHISGDII